MFYGAFVKCLFRWLAIFVPILWLGLRRLFSTNTGNCNTGSFQIWPRLLSMQWSNSYRVLFDCVFWLPSSMIIDLFVIKLRVMYTLIWTGPTPFLFKVTLLLLQPDSRWLFFCSFPTNKYGKTPKGLLTYLKWGFRFYTHFHLTISRVVQPAKHTKRPNTPHSEKLAVSRNRHSNQEETQDQ